MLGHCLRRWPNIGPTFMSMSRVFLETNLELSGRLEVGLFQVFATKLLVYLVLAYSVWLNCIFSARRLPSTDELHVALISVALTNICITFIQRRPNVFDAGPTLYKCYTIFCVYSEYCG